MRNMSLAIRAVAFLAVAGGLGLFIGWLVSRQNDVKPLTLPPVVSAPAVAEEPEPAPPPVTVRAPVQPVHATAEEPAQTAAPELTEATVSTNWEQSLEGILLSDDDDNTKADHILALIPTAPPDAQAELAQHLVNMVQDDHYENTADLLTNSTTPSAVSTVLMNDLLNRNNNLKLPTLLDIARTDDHPLKDQAREMLELLLQEDHGSNWDDWSTSINNWLTQNQPQ
jgi:hypothetical protein